MTAAGLLLIAAWATPLILLIACLNVSFRASWPILLPAAPLPALAAALLVPTGTTAGFPAASYGLTFELSGPAAMLLGGAALLWISAAAYAAVSRREDGNDERFVVWWLATLTGSLGIFIAADLYGFYLFFTIVSLSAYWLVVGDETAAANRAGSVYVAFALLGEAFLLLAFVLLAAATPGHSLLIRDAVTAIPSSPARDIILTLIVLGFGVKIALVPLHVWMPLTYTAAPVAVAAVLSGAAVKAGVIGLIRFLPFDVALAGWGHFIAAAGLFGAFYGVVIGLTQRDPRTVLAYSSISQMGVIATVIGMGLASGLAATPTLAAFYAFHHILVKGGLFLAIGICLRDGLRCSRLVQLSIVIVALGLGGLPLTGGALTKLAVKPVLGETVGMLSMASAACSTLLMMHFLRRLWLLAQSQSDGTRSSSLVAAPWLAMAFAAIALPWVLYPMATGDVWSEALTTKALWESLWPVLAGAAIALPLYSWGRQLPTIPPGDILAAGPTIVSFGQRIGAAIEHTDTTLQRWPVAGVTVLLLVILLTGAMLTGG